MEAHGSWSHHCWGRKYHIPPEDRQYSLTFVYLTAFWTLNLWATKNDSNSTYHDSVCTMLLCTRSVGRPDDQSSQIWKHSGLIQMPAENRLYCSEREGDVTWLKCRSGNQPSAEHLRNIAAYLSSARIVTQSFPQGQEPAMLLSGCRKLSSDSSVWSPPTAVSQVNDFTK